jgi:hypothetical protein
VPVAAAGLADVGARDPQPLVLGRSREHVLEQLAVARLQLAALLQRHTHLADPLRQRVANPLELLETRDPRLAEAGGNAGVKSKAWKRRGADAGELVLQAADLPAQLRTGKALVAPNPKRCQRVSVEQIQHRNPSECRSPPRG